jgi:hypothetical protein
LLKDTRQIPGLAWDKRQVSSTSKYLGLSSSIST